MLDERIDRHLVALHDVEDAIRQARLFEQFREPEGRRGVAFGRLQHESVPARERHRKHPHWDHGRKVEWSNSRHYAKRLARRSDCRSLRQSRHCMLAFKQVRDAAGKLDDFHSANHFSLSVGENFAVFPGDERGQFIVMLFQQCLESKKKSRASKRRKLRPGGKAARAAETAASTSAREARATWAATSPVAGLKHIACSASTVNVLAANKVLDASGCGARRRAFLLLKFLWTWEFSIGVLKVQVALKNPFVRWIIVEVPHTFRACHDVEVIRFVAMRNDDGVIAARH